MARVHIFGRICVIVVSLCTSLTPLDCWGAPQRMLMLPQVLNLGANTAGQINAYCLDHAGDIPEESSHFAAIPLGQAQVTVDGHQYSWQQAIDSGKLSVEGTGDFSSLRLVNRGAGEMRVDIKAPSVATPARHDSVQDVRATVNMAMALSSIPEHERQNWIWGQRAARELGISDASFAHGQSLAGSSARVVDYGRLTIHGRTYDVHTWDMLELQQAVAKEASRGGPYIIQRLSPLDDDTYRQPAYVLYTGQGKPRLFSGVNGLADLANEANRAHLAAGNPRKLTFAMTGDAQTIDFDLMQINVRQALKDADVRFSSRGTYEDVDAFTPPDDELSLEGVTIKSTNEGFMGRQELSNGQQITVYAATKELVMQILAAIRDVLLNFMPDGAFSARMIELESSFPERLNQIKLEILRKQIDQSIREVIEQNHRARARVEVKAELKNEQLEEQHLMFRYGALTPAFRFAHLYAIAPL